MSAMATEDRWMPSLSLIYNIVSVRQLGHRSSWRGNADMDARGGYLRWAHVTFLDSRYPDEHGPEAGEQESPSDFFRAWSRPSPGAEKAQF